jgi:hypothetical protein
MDRWQGAELVAHSKIGVLALLGWLHNMMVVDHKRVNVVEDKEMHFVDVEGH